MTEQEYTERKKQLEKQLQLDLAKLRREYAEIHNPYKVGDVITDHYHSIRIESMVAMGGYYDQYPYMLYRGVELKKDGTPTKRQVNTEMHQINIGKPRI
jgi:hypothetical protein